MRPYRSLPTLADAPEVLDGGHLWLQEYVPGPVLAVAVEESGLLRFGIDGREIEPPPPSLERSVEHLRRTFDRDRFREGVDDVTEFVFYGTVTRNEGHPYEWSDLAPFLGLDIWSAEEDRYVAPDVAERVFAAVGVDPLPAFRKELPVSQFDPERYTVPESHWDDRQAAGVVVRNKSGGMGLLRTATFSPATDPPDELETVVLPLVSQHIDRILVELGTDVCAVDVDVLTDRIRAVVARVAYADLAPLLESRPEAFQETVGDAVRSIVRMRVSDGERA
ncbi:MAG: hypothetical protein ABEJ59_04100 [Halanaeroarchaeum sp.]